jgi:aspartate racemase
MKKIGLIGGITPESTILYYRILNQLNAQKLGDKHSAKVIMNSFDFGEISKLQTEGNWEKLNQLMATAGKNLENGRATCILICANTMHLCIDAVRKVVNIPVIHIAEATAKEIKKKGLKKVSLLGTKYTMEKDFFKDILTSFGIETIIPEKEDRNEIHNVIYNELSKGELKPSSKENYIKMIKKQIASGAEGIIL